MNSGKHLKFLPRFFVWLLAAQATCSLGLPADLPQFREAKGGAPISLLLAFCTRKSSIRHYPSSSCTFPDRQIFAVQTSTVCAILGRSERARQIEV